MSKCTEYQKSVNLIQVNLYWQFLLNKYYFTFDIKNLIGAAQGSLPILDACSNSPCYDNVTCYPDINSVDGFFCGECPLGMTGDGQACFDLDEVLLFLL